MIPTRTPPGSFSRRSGPCADKRAVVNSASEHHGAPLFSGFRRYIINPPDFWNSKGESMKIRLALCFVALLMAATLFGQTFYGSIIGSVTDASSSGVPQATVTLTNLGTAERRSMVTSASGGYDFVNLVPGQYKIDVEKAGFRRFARDPIAVEVQSVVRIDVTLQVGDINQLVEVTAETPLLQTENASLG